MKCIKKLKATTKTGIHLFFQFALILAIDYPYKTIKNTEKNQQTCWKTKIMDRRMCTSMIKLQFKYLNLVTYEDTIGGVDQISLMPFKQVTDSFAILLMS